VVADLATQVPTSVICEMLGIDYGDRGRFVAWSDAALALQGTARPSLETALAAQDGYVGLQRFFGDLVADRQAHPRGTQERPDLLTDLITATEDGERLSEGDLVQTCLTLLMGGYETTASLIANTVVLLGTHLEVRDQVAGDRSLLEPLIEESLRIESPIQTVTRRVASDVEVGDQTLHEGDLAITMIGAANRDPRRFEDPDTFDLHRDRGHVAFGYSTHFCLGAALARMEAPIAIGSLLDRVPTFELAEDDIDWNAGKVVIRCPRTLALRF
jgi:cytochrome P450